MKPHRFTLAALLLVPAIACAETPAKTSTDSSSSAQPIVRTAISTGKFNSLVAAVKAAGWADVLSGPGPFTLLAPTDTAFDKLPQGTLDGLLDPANKDQLVAVLKHHVISGDLPAAEVKRLDSATTLQGSDLTISHRDGALQINDASVVDTDIKCSNGVIHAIDNVLLPKQQAAPITTPPSQP